MNPITIAAFSDELEKISISLPGVGRLLSGIGSAAKRLVAPAAKITPSTGSLASETAAAAKNVASRTGFKIPGEWMGHAPAAKTVSLGPKGHTAIHAPVGGPAIKPQSSPGSFNMPSGGGTGELPGRVGSRQYLPAGKKSWSLSAEEMRVNPALHRSAATGGLTSTQQMLSTAQTQPGLINLKYASIWAKLRASGTLPPRNGKIS